MLAQMHQIHHPGLDKTVWVYSRRALLVVMMSLVVLMAIVSPIPAVVTADVKVDEADDAQQHGDLRRIVQNPSIPSTSSSQRRGQERQEDLELLLHRVQGFIHDATLYLMDVCDETGKLQYVRFLHESLVDPSVVDTSEENNDNRHVDVAGRSYNLLRHAGVIYALGMALDRQVQLQKSSQPTTKNDQMPTLIFETMQRAVAFLQLYIGPVPAPRPVNEEEEDDWTAQQYASVEDQLQDHHRMDQDGNMIGLRAVFETAELVGKNPDTFEMKAKLGGAGLAMIAMTSTYKHLATTTSNTNDGGNTILLEDMRALALFCVFLQRDDGSFDSFYTLPHGKNDGKKPSRYYPGEAALGLLLLAELEVTNNEPTTTNEENPYAEVWRQAAMDTLLYLEASRRDEHYNHLESDHWALIATAKLLPTMKKEQEDDDEDDTYDQIYNHGLQVVQRMILKLSKEEVLSYRGAHQETSGVCGTATSLEGLLSALEFLEANQTVRVRQVRRRQPQDEEEANKDNHHGADEYPRQWVTIPVRERILWYVRMGAHHILSSQDLANAAGFVGAVPNYGKEPYDEVQIDFVQHSLSAMIRYERLLLLLLSQQTQEDVFASTTTPNDWPPQDLRRVLSTKDQRQQHQGHTKGPHLKSTTLSVGYFLLILISIIAFLRGASQLWSRRNQRRKSGDLLHKTN